MKTYTYTVTAAPDNGGYLINGELNPPLDLQSNTTYIFNVQAPGHPFYIKTDRVLGDASAYDFQVTGNGAEQGNVKIVLSMGPVPKLFYQCANHIKMGGSLTNVKHIDNSIKHALGDQLPGFVSAEYPMFQRFLEAYYEWLGSPGQVDYNIQSVVSNADVDNSVDLYLQQLETEFLNQIPKDIEIDKRLLIKNIRSFYNSKGTEKSYEFLFNILFNENVEFYYPKNDILRASDGKWETVTSIRFLNDDNYDVFALTGKTIYQDYVYVNPETNLPETRLWAQAKVERIIQFFLGDNLITEAYLSNLEGLGDFNASTSDDEDDREFIYYKDEENNPYMFRIVPMVTTIQVESQGTGYSAGTLLNIDTANGDTGVGASAQISSIFPGNIQDINLVSNGEGYRVNDKVQFESSAQVGGSGAAAFVSEVSVDGMEYAAGSVDYTGRGISGSPILNFEVADILNDDTTTFAKSYVFKVRGPGSWTASALLNNLSVAEFGGTVKFDYFNVWVGDTLAEVQAALIGDAEIAVTDQTLISNYTLGTDVIDDDKFIRIEFTASISGATYDEGAGETAEMNVSFSSNFIANGAIKEIKMDNFGSGYRRVPTATIISQTGTGAAVTADGSNIGRIKEVKLLNQNFGALYYANPSIDMSNLGNGDAAVSLGTGSVARHPGIFRNDDGHLSEAKYLQDNKYYQTFSYVLRTGLSIENYRDTIKKLVHPSGMELFGEVFITNNLRAGLYNNFTSDPNDLIVSERLGGLQIPKYKKTIMLFKTNFVDTVTYGGGIKEGQLYKRPTIIDKFINVNGEEIPVGTKKIFNLEPVTLGVDPTDVRVFSFPVLKFPIQTDIENIIIDNTVEVSKVITMNVRDEMNVEVADVFRRDKKVIRKEFGQPVEAQTLRPKRQTILHRPLPDLGVASWFKNVVLVGVGELRDIDGNQLISDIDNEYTDIKNWARDLSLSVRIDSQLVDKYSTQVLDILLNADLTVGAFRTLERTIDLDLDVPVDTSSLYQHEISLNTNTEVTSTDRFSKRIVSKVLDLSVDMQREIHRHWTTHNYLLTAPQSVSVEMVAAEEKTQEITILSGFKELHDYGDLIIGDISSSEIRSLDPTFLQVIPRDFIYRNIPIEKVLTQIVTNVAIQNVGQHIKRSIFRNADLTVGTTFHRKLGFSEEVSTRMTGRDETQQYNKNMNLFNGFIYKIEENTIDSLDPDNTQIRSIANSQLVSTTLMGYIRDSDDNIVGTL
jgi:hypothetical protein